MPRMDRDAFDGALATAKACFISMEAELEEANAIIAGLRSKLPQEIPVQTRDVDSKALADRASLYTWLDKQGYRRKGDLVYLTPLHRSYAVEGRAYEQTVVAKIATETRTPICFWPRGIRLERFRKNPVVLCNHDYEGLPVARSLWERVRDGVHGPEMIAKPQFHMDTELSREVFGLVINGKLSAWELGVIPETWEKRGEGYYVTSWDVLEYSVVPRPEDMEALRKEHAAGHISAPALTKSIFKDWIDTSKEGEVDDGRAE